MQRRYFYLVLGLFSILVQDIKAGQIIPTSPESTESIQENEGIEDSLGRSNPKGTVMGFFNSLAREDYLQASQYTDLMGVSENADEATSVRFVMQFKSVLDRYGKITPINLISANPQGNKDDGLVPDMEWVGSITFKGKITPVFLKKTAGSEGVALWLISTQNLTSFIDEVSAVSDLDASAPDTEGLFSSKWKGAPVNEWIITGLLAIGTYLLSWLFTVFLGRMVRSIWKNYEHNRYKRILRTLLIPLRLVVMVFILLQVSRALGISIVVRQALGVFNLIAMWTALFIFIWLLTDALTTAVEARMRDRRHFGGLSAISFFRNTAKFILIITALLMIFNTIGMNVTAGLAALGVGGIALALGAQKTIENVIGGLSVVFDQPVSVGDFCRFGDTLGTVEKIGMRSTRIRTNHRTVVTVPNADFSSRLIENFSKRDLFLYHKTIGLRHETTSHQMRFVLVELRKILYAHPKVDPNPARVRFLGYASDSLQVEIYAYTRAKDWNDYLGIQEDINLRLAKVIEDSGSGFAYPSQRIYIAEEKGLSKAKKDKVETKVNKWIENEELQLPEFDPETIKKLKGSIEYPSGDLDRM
ncbi:MscS family membrane protein [Muriicola jejuensis]|uniref:Mechanosensitive ion channel n=1 Tax=Muriicola jejuensis TaxID=504488 RepID=A0A6P0UEJ9_9FLAO|nr:mechanosensitive ion channel family protein [Muriicola jejuensis]NER11701.1 mechanosensitive ion channel [Muriicola jejuensis]SMP25399.1 MscS family membrane protein [Muriicola jejuensis]